MAAAKTTPHAGEDPPMARDRGVHTTDCPSYFMSCDKWFVSFGGRGGLGGGGGGGCSDLKSNLLEKLEMDVFA